MNSRPRFQKNKPFLNTFLKSEMLLGGWGVVSSGIAFLSTYILLSSLDVFHYGVYVLVIAFFSLVSNFTLSLLQDVVESDIIRFIGEGNTGKAKRLFLENAAVQLGTATILSIGVFLSAALIASWYDEDIAMFIRLASPLFLISATYTTMRMFLKVHLRFDIIASRSTVYNILRLTFLSSFLIFSSLNVKNALIAHVGASFVAMLIFVLPFLRVYRPWKLVTSSEEWLLWKILKTHGKWSILKDIFSVTSIDNLSPWLIKFFVNTEAVAIYSVAESLYGALKNLFPVVTIRTLIPRIMHDGAQATQMVVKSVKYLFMYAVLLGLFAAAVAPPFVFLLFPQYRESVVLFHVILLALPFHAFRAPTRAFLVGARRQRFLFTRGIIMTPFSLISQLVLLSFFGVIGMAIERVLFAATISVFIFWHLVQRDIPLSEWGEIFLFDKRDKQLFVRSRRLLKGWFRAKFGLS